MASTKPLVLMTGASGFIGQHTLNAFLTKGYRVRVVGRSQKSGERITELHKSFRSQIETVVIPDITVSSVYDQYVHDVDGIIHLASPFVLKVEDNERDLIIPALNGTKNILESAYKYGKNVKRIVITSSFASIIDFSKGLRPGYRYDETDWNPITYEQTKNDTRGVAYPGSKKIAEKFAWSFMESHPDASFSLATIHPVNVFGPPFPGSADVDHLGESMSAMYKVFKAAESDNANDPVLVRTAVPVFVDARDVADAHRLAYESKLEKPGRFLVSAGTFTNKGVFEFWKEGSDKAFDPSRQAIGLDGIYEIDTTRARTELGMVFKQYNECFGDMGVSLKELASTKPQL